MSTGQTILLSVSTDDGKYTVIQHADGHLSMLRHGQPWVDRVEPYAKAILVLAQDLEATRIKLKQCED
jgi:hypothetical protein